MSQNVSKARAASKSKRQFILKYQSDGSPTPPGCGWWVTLIGLLLALAGIALTIAYGQGWLKPQTQGQMLQHIEEVAPAHGAIASGLRTA
jgi:hypothetical protein